MFSNRRHLQQLQGFLVGLAVTASTVGYFFGSTKGNKLELDALDWRMRKFNNLRPDPRIVHVDIDDNAVNRIERWPWKRRAMADLIRAVSEFDPNLIMVDFLFSEPEKPYHEDPRLDALPGEEAQVVGRVSDSNIVYGELELVDAVRSAGNVILSAELDVLAPSQPDPLAYRLRREWALDTKGGIDTAIRELHLPDTPEVRTEVAKELLRLRMVSALTKKFTLTESQLADSLQCRIEDISALFAGAKTEAATKILSGKPLTGTRLPRSLNEALERVLKKDAGRRTADRRDVIHAYNLLAARRAAGRAARWLESGTSDCLFRSHAVIPPVTPIAEAAFDMAVVDFLPDYDGVVRRVPVVVHLARHAGYLHLGLVAACHALGIDLRRSVIIGSALPPISLDSSGSLIIPSKEGPGRILPLDGDGGYLIHWAAGAEDWRSGKDMPHISAAKLMSIPAARRAIHENNIAMRYKLADVVAASAGEFTATTAPGEGGDKPAGVTGYADTAYRTKVAELIELERSHYLARLRQSSTPEELADADKNLAALRAEIEAAEKRAIGAITLACRDLAEYPEEEIAADPALAADAKRYRAAMKIIDEDIAALKQANESLESRIRQTTAELTERLRGKFVFIGFAATAQGDIVPSAIDSRTNGVMCHAHVFNTILQDRSIRVMPGWAGVLICFAGGAVVSLITSTQAPRLALLLTLGLMACYAAVNCEVLFKRMDTWVALAAPEICVFVSWAFVTLFRQLTAEREKRLFSKQLAQYTSPIIAAKLAENPQAAQAFKTVQTRDITAFFSDLKGFTTLTEEEDPELIQHVLNTYLRRMSEVIWSRHGLLNKFMGDGIMAFFNASVDPLKDHALAAVETSLLAMEELGRLKVENKSDPAARIFNALEMRVGLASGLAKNGDMGSDLKADYTVIGDVVNLAARLEPANKVFATSIMVSGPTRNAVCDQYDLRYLAELQVKGKAQTVPVYEVVCRKGQITPEQKEYIERYQAGVDLYKARKWDECIVHFTRMLARRFDDAGASRYIDACQEFKQFPPDENWRGALELKEK